MKTVIPFVDLYAQYLTIKEQLDEVINRVIRDSLFVRGPYVDQFEKMFSELMNRRYCVSCGNGTDSLYIAMKALGVKPGDEVIVPAHSWISTSETVTQAGATVIFCDTDATTFTIDPDAIRSKITSRTVGIIPVHLYGQPCDMDPIVETARSHNLWLLEDCAQAHLAHYKGKLVGTFGNVASFSFYPGKNLGAMGDAGAIVTNDQALAERMAMFSRHGGLTKGDHRIEGINSRMDGLQAAVLTVKLPHLVDWTKRRQERASDYSKLLTPIKGVGVPVVANNREHVWHLYVIRHKERNRLAEHLAKIGIQTVINYPKALPFLPAYSRLGHQPGDFPNAFSNQNSVISLPLYPEIPRQSLEAVADAIRDFGCSDHK